MTTEEVAHQLAALVESMARLTERVEAMDQQRELQQQPADQPRGTDEDPGAGTEVSERRKWLNFNITKFEAKTGQQTWHQFLEDFNMSCTYHEVGRPDRAPG